MARGKNNRRILGNKLQRGIMTDAQIMKDTRSKLGLTQQEFADEWWNGDQKSISLVEVGNRGLTAITRKYIEYIRDNENLNGE